MKNIRTLKSVISVILAMLLMLSAVIPVFAVKIEEEKQKIQYLYMFNDAVNSIKEKRPAFRYEKTGKLNTEGGYSIGSKTAADLSDEAARWLNWIIESLVTSEEGLFNGLIANLTDSNSDYVDMQIAKGADVTTLLPVSGKDYVSALEVNDPYELSYIEENNKERLIYYFPDCLLADKEESALPKLYNLPSGKLNPVIFGDAQFDEEGNDPLDKVELSDFEFLDAAVQADFNEAGELTSYVQKISYSFSLSCYDLVRIFDAYTGNKWNLMTLALGIANEVFEKTDRPQVTAEEVLKDSLMFIRYDVNMKLSKFDWLPRYFGDIDNSGNVEARDARLALRHSVGLENITNQESLIYGDVNFDGTISSADARHILRTAVGLEKKFDEVPEGETVKIVVIVPPEVKPEIPEEEEKPDETPDEENPDNSGPDLPTIDETTDFITGVIGSIFDIVYIFKGDADGDGKLNDEEIDELFQNIDKWLGTEDTPLDLTDPQ